MILFAADDHYQSFPGRNIHSEIAADYPDMRFFENDWECFTRFDLAVECRLLILHMIAGTCNLPLPGQEAAEAVRRYFETGKPVLLLHGGSAAFWPFDWFREAAGLRWVRGNDPDGVVASFHPKEPYRVEPAKCRHPLVSRLIPMDLPQDEIYTALEQTRPMWVLMNTTISSGTFPQCTESTSPWGGRVINFLPGHAATVTRDPALIANVRTLIDSLLA